MKAGGVGGCGACGGGGESRGRGRVNGGDLRDGQRDARGAGQGAHVHLHRRQVRGVSEPCAQAHQAAEERREIEKMRIK